MSKQTAIEWLEDNLICEPWSEEHFKHNKECWYKAKEMEKEQMKEMYIKGIENYDPTFKRKDNETFKSE